MVAGLRWLRNQRPFFGYESKEKKHLLLNVVQCYALFKLGKSEPGSELQMSIV
jgi:hypothetical protein